MISAIDVAEYHPELLKNEVAFETTEAPGTVVIDTEGPFLYLVQGLFTTCDRYNFQASGFEPLGHQFNELCFIID